MQPGTVYGFRHVVTAAEVTASEFAVHTKGAQITGALAFWRSAAGVFKGTPDFTLVVDSPEKITIAEGATQMVAGDTFDIVFF